VQDFELTIRQLQAGTGLIQTGLPNPALGDPNAELSSDLDALAAFVESLAPKKSPYRNSDGSLTAAAIRGKSIFERNDVGCSACHTGPSFTDSDPDSSPFTTHDVGTGGGAGERLGPAFDTPTLLGIWDTAPYLHDGRAEDLEDVLTGSNPDDLHGVTSILSLSDRTDLVVYLLSL
jgi:cytochrome c peroxidase